MATPFLGEITLFAGNFAPRGWAFCNGQLLDIASNSALFSLLGTIYGGDGRTTFALPDLRGRTPMHEGTGFPLGSRSGTETETLTVAELPAHSHTAVASGDQGSDTSAADNTLAAQARREIPIYADASNLVPLQNATVGATASNAHENMQPFLALNFIIALQGVFPSRN